MIVKPEQQDVEYKSASEGRMPKDIWKTIVAFANTDGGVIYLGVNPEGQEVKFTREQADRLQRDIINICNNGTLSIQFLPEVRLIGKNRTVMVIIPAIQAALRPVYAVRQGLHNGTYVRVGSANVKADKEHIARFFTAARGGAEQIWYDENWTKVLDLSAIEQYIDRLNQNHNNVYQNYDLPEVLIKLHVLDRNRHKVSLFGLLVFGNGRLVQEIVSPNVNIAVTQYAGTDKITSDDLAQTYISDQEFNGNVVVQFEAVLSFIKSKIPTRSIVNSTGQREIRPVIPEIALREALANALVHRDYSIMGARIQINLFTNRLEIINPGQSLIPIDQLDVSPSLTRNPLLMNFLKDYGIVEQKGRGIRTIYRSIRDEELNEPVFENIGDQAFRITIFNTPALSRTEHEILAELAPGLNHRQKNAVVYAKKHSQGINNSEYRHINDMILVRDDKKANKELNELVQLGIFESTGVGRWRRYLLRPKIAKCLA